MIGRCATLHSHGSTLPGSFCLSNIPRMPVRLRIALTNHSAHDTTTHGIQWWSTQAPKTFTQWDTVLEAWQPMRIRWTTPLCSWTQWLMWKMKMVQRTRRYDSVVHWISSQAVWSGEVESILTLSQEVMGWNAVAGSSREVSLYPERQLLWFLPFQPVVRNSSGIPPILLQSLKNTWLIISICL